MRDTFSTLLQTTKDLAIDDSITSTTGITATEKFLKNQINDTIQFLFSKVRNYKTIPLPQTFSTVADQIYYHNPPGLLNIQSLTIAIGDTTYPLKVINSQERWDKLQQIDITSSTVPQYFFPRQSDFGIWPTPSAVYTATIVGNFLPRRLTESDYSDGTVALTQNDATVTGTNTAFNTNMVGRWFCITDSSGFPTGNWYRVASYSTTTSIELESVFEEASVSGGSYVIAQSPELPEELHQFIPYRAASVYHATYRKDMEQAQRLLNFFYTGDFLNGNRNGKIDGGILGVINMYKNLGRGNTQIVELHKGQVDRWRQEAWGTTLTEA